MLTPPQFKICNSITEHIYDVFESIHVCNKITQSMGSLKFSDFYRLALFFGFCHFRTRLGTLLKIICVVKWTIEIHIKGSIPSKSCVK